MKRVLIVCSIMTLVTPAFAAPVRGSDGPAPPSAAQQKAAERKAREDEKAYKDALDRIPTSTKKQDPWDKMR